MNSIYKSIEKYRDYIFLALLIVLYLVLDYQTILFLRPQGVHFIRQTDSLSFAANYFKNGFDFFHPQVFNLRSTDGRAACEFPVLYYLTAILYLIFNEHEFLLRLITILIASTGFFFLFKLLYSFLKDVVFTLVLSFIFISSTVLLYYTNNYLPDASALGLTLCGWYFFFCFFNNRNKRKPLYACTIFFTLAALLKVTYFINPVAAILSVVAYDFYKGTGIKNTLKSNVLPIILFVLSVAMVLSWNLYALHYNRVNNCNSFLLQQSPIWRVSKCRIIEIWGCVTQSWYTSYYYESVFHFYFIVIIAGLIFIKKSDKVILFPSFILAAGSIAYFLLFYTQFMDHDYYFITMIPGIILLVTSSFIALRNKFPRLINTIVVKLTLVTLCVLSLNYARQKLNQRYNNNNDPLSVLRVKISVMRPLIDSMGIAPNAKIIIYTDPSNNGSLYFINRPGWTIRDTSESCRQEFNYFVNHGAEYILYTDKKYIDNTIKCEKRGERNGISIYKIN